VRLRAEPEVAEAAVTVVDALQGQGLGKLLLRRLSEAARERGIRRFRGQVLTENTAARKLLQSIDPHARLIAHEPGSEEYEVLLPDVVAGARASAT
jgi:GNAT superfamily N-acetyltransferase